LTFVCGHSVFVVHVLCWWHGAAVDMAHRLQRKSQQYWYNSRKCAYENL